MNVFVTGGTGYIGTRMIAALLQRGHAVRALVRDTAAARIGIARFFAENIAVAASGLERTVVEAADSVNNAAAALN